MASAFVEYVTTLGDLIPDDTDFFGLYLKFSFFIYVFVTYLDVRQHKMFKIKKRPADIKYVSDKEFTANQAYGLDKSSFGFITGFFGQIEGTITLFALPWLWDFAKNIGQEVGYEGEIIQSCIFMYMTILISTIINIPFDLYSTFVIEAKHGFNKSTIGLYITDTLKKLALYGVIGLPLVSAIISVIQWGGEHFYLYVWLVMLIFQLFMIIVFPTYIQPCFNKVEPLPEGELKTAIEKLAASISFPLTQLYVIDGSKRSNHSNAYFYGFFKAKRIVLFDTLLEQCDNDEIVAILGHELGHWKMGHTLQGLVVTQIILFVNFFLFGQVMSNKYLYASFGFHDTQPTFIGLMLFSYIFSPVDTVLGYLMKLNSRKNEFEADAFGKKLGYGTQLASGLIKLQKENKGALIADPWYSSYHYSHPPVPERLAALRGVKAA